ncbi:MAG: UvrD-helicase domain-containing protein [Candidatus Sumerlaeaceae bacterium]
MSQLLSGERPFADWSTAEIAEEIESSWNERSRLEAIRHELQFRKRREAQAQFIRVGQRLHELTFKPTIAIGSKQSQGAKAPVSSSLRKGVQQASSGRTNGSEGTTLRGSVKAARRPHPATQKDVITLCRADRAVVLAGPGTGKTETVARRLVHLIEGEALAPKEIIVLSYSCTAVNVLTRRIASIQGIAAAVREDLRFLSIRTFDSWSFRMLREHGIEVSALFGSDSYDRNIHMLAELLNDSARLSGSKLRPLLAGIKHLIVDECQDLTGVRALLVKRLLQYLSRSSQFGFTILGDPNQGIYDWAGSEKGISSVELINWISVEPQVALLRFEKNFRSTEAAQHSLVADAAKHLNSGATAEFFALVNGRVAACTLNAFATFKPELNGAGMLCYTNGQALALASNLLEEHPHLSKHLRLEAGSNPSRVPLWFGLFFSRFKSDEISSQHFVQLYNKLQASGVRMPQGNSESSWLMLIRAARQRDGDSKLSLPKLRDRLLWRDFLPDDEQACEPMIEVTTIHQSKGREFDLVAVSDAPTFGKWTAEDLSKIQYVGISRARQKLVRLGTEQGSMDLSEKKLKQGRKRWHSWSKTRKGSFNLLEIGIPDDLDEVAFLMPKVIGSPEAVLELQEYFRTSHQELVGQEIVLTREWDDDEDRSFYFIRLGDESGRVLGRMAAQLPEDLYYLPGEQRTKLSMPKNIRDLRIQEIVTCVLRQTQEVIEPWATTKLWLGLRIHGLGSYNVYWKA